jgi:hypothetical protein
MPEKTHWQTDVFQGQEICSLATCIAKHWTKVTDTKEDRWRAERERERNCDVSLANNSLHTSSAYFAKFSSTFLRFGNVVDWYDDVCFTLGVTEYFIHQLSGLPVWNLAPATFTSHVLIHQLYVWCLIPTRHSHNVAQTQYSHLRRNNIPPQASVQHVAEADWLTRAHDMCRIIRNSAASVHLRILIR